MDVDKKGNHHARHLLEGTNLALLLGIAVCLVVIVSCLMVYYWRKKRKRLPTPELLQPLRYPTVLAKNAPPRGRSIVYGGPAVEGPPDLVPFSLPPSTMKRSARDMSNASAMTERKFSIPSSIVVMSQTEEYMKTSMKKSNASSGIWMPPHSEVSSEFKPSTKRKDRKPDSVRKSIGNPNMNKEGPAIRNPNVPWPSRHDEAFRLYASKHLALPRKARRLPTKGKLPAPPTFTSIEGKLALPISNV